MKALIWKEWRENVKWLPLPGLVILLVFLIDKPETPMFAATDAYFFCVIAAVFGTALGFVQIFFEGHGDKRSLLLQRPLSASRIFLAKALAGVGLYLLALGVPFVCLETWLATPGNMPAPFQWRTCLPWLADILSGLVYYFAGMLAAQREARWLGSRCLPLAAALFCSCLVWALTEFWQALAAIALFTSFMGVAAWSSFTSGGAYDSQPRIGRLSLATILLAGLLLVSMFVKQIIGQGFGSEVIYICDLTRQGRVLSEIFHLHEYDLKGTQLADLDHQQPSAEASYAKALFGLATPMTEAATLVGLSESLRSQVRSEGRTNKPVLLDYLFGIRRYIPGTSRFENNPSGLMLVYVTLILLAAATSALVCFVLARSHAFSLARSIGWGVIGVLFGWVGLFLMLALQDWPARTTCPKCRKQQIVTRDLCEHCGARHAAPAADGREIFESAITVAKVALTAS